MEALVRPPQSGQDPELVFEWPSLEAAPIGRPAWIGSLLVHAIGLGIFLLIPKGMTTPPATGHGLRAGVHLIAPPRELTFDHVVPVARGGGLSVRLASGVSCSPARR